MGKAKGICIAMAVHNGADHLLEQLESIKRQTIPPKWLVVSDDDSTDSTIEILQEFFRFWDDCKLIMVKGPCRNYAQNFLSALKAVPSDADFVALADQDDIWLEEKLERSVMAMSSENNEPTLYGSASWVWTPESDERRLSWRSDVPLGFNHALAQNFAGGNTMVLNRGAYHLLQSALPHAANIPVHDWWLYQLISGAGGRMIYDAQPTLLYRQHPHNQIGANDGFRSMLARGKAMLRGTYRDWNTANFEALSACSHLLDPQNRSILEDLCSARSSGVTRRLHVFSRQIVRRHGLIGQTGLLLSLLLDKF